MDTWSQVAGRQAGVVSYRQLRELAVGRALVRHKLASGRWVRRTDAVVTTTTGPLSEEQRRWVAVLHCGPGAMLGGLTALAVRGLRGWPREDVTVIVENADSFDPVEGVRTFRTRRPLDSLRGDDDLPCCRVEPAALLWAGHEPHPRSAMGLLAAVVQQQLTSPERLAAWVEALRPLRRAPMIRDLLHDLAGGSQSLGEVDVVRMCRAAGLRPPNRQTRRVDRSGRVRFTDCEWELDDGRTLVLEVDGGFHLEVVHYEEDVRRHRSLTTPDRIVVRCTTQELRREPWVVTNDLRALGVPRLDAA
ncbi:hypothetical protein H9L10_14780 [Phycicoccus endophyticus]|uniref:DUF559 domain-containing protein n=1 Tax=Phycicoccus endophyticus TaxID=1690220 RepID=A0A7G9R1F4_9MICO|nr:hypothetical protein [Phycicoccus endophyticus]NHI18784.1 hypothetical protein [Phycicoccus endophyticus]QNN49429.1 hypothetical protein H9L10_14780 [Phycicoccus endophyticus]GGL36587.1 hypothetical protein GCM10012283_18750 [Phycicoccus endophyticus]